MVTFVAEGLLPLSISYILEMPMKYSNFASINSTYETYETGFVEQFFVICIFETDGFEVMTENNRGKEYIVSFGAKLGRMRFLY